jgi:triosephosphate isomerase
MKPLIIANWKMNLGVKKSVKTIRQLNSCLKKFSSQNYELVVCPSFIALEEIHSIFKKTRIALGAQDVFWAGQGAYTGEISASMLKEVDCKYVIIGHSERRQYLDESDLMMNKKLKQVFKVNLIPILCVGENLRERIYGSTKKVVLEQLKKDLLGVRIKNNQQLIIAYEPVWAIGSGKAVTTKQAVEIRDYIYEVMVHFFAKKFVDKNIKIIYGGSVNAKNVANFVGQGKLAGVLVGGASLRAEEMCGIVKRVISKQ